MKKSLFTLAVLAASSVACAQSSVTLFGVVDVNAQRLSNGGGASVSRITHSGNSSSRLGFRGAEDLGGGMSASFWLEAGVNVDDGSGSVTGTNNQGATTGGGGLTFNRRSTVSLAGNWGELRLGRDIVPQYWNLTQFDPFGTVGVGANIITQQIITGAAAVRASNSVHYLLPRTLGGVYGQLTHYRGENLSNAASPDDGNGWGARVGYASGPVNVALATSQTERAAGDYRQTNIAGSWKFDFGTLMAQYSNDEAGATDATGYLLGGVFPVRAGEVRVSLAQHEVDPGAGADPRSRKFALGYVHNLSKRTAVYATYARVRNSNGATAPVATGAGNAGANASASGFDLGLRHSF